MPFVPLCVNQLDRTGKTIKAYFFLNNIPKRVLSAVQHYPNWSVSDSSILREYYGSRWKSLLTPEDIQEKEATSMSFFTKTVFGGDDDATDTINVLNLESQPAFASWTVKVKNIPITYTTFAVYDEDTIFELRSKIAFISGIPIARQHFFYYLNGEGPNYPYKIYSNDLPVLIEWQEMKQQDNNAKQISGVSIDLSLESNRNMIRVESFDTFIQVKIAEGVRVSQSYFIDIFDVLQIDSSVLNDKYQMEMIYYGFILKFFPHLSIDAFHLLYSDIKQLELNYPKLTQNIHIENIYRTEQNIANLAHKYCQTVSIAISEAVIKVPSLTVRSKAVIRNIIDSFELSPTVIALLAKIDVDSSLMPDADTKTIRTSGLIPLKVIKRHISSYRLKQVNKFLERQIKRDTLVLMIKKEADIQNDHPTSFVYLNIYPDCHYEIVSSWRTDDKIDSEKILHQLLKIITPVINKINEFQSLVFPIGGFLSLKGLTFQSLTVSSLWQHTLSSIAFTSLKSQFRIFEKANLISIRGLQQTNIFSFLFRKGMLYEIDFIEGLANQYEWLNSQTILEKWDSTFSGKLVRLFHRTTDLKMECENVSMDEFYIIQRYVFSFMDFIYPQLCKLKPEPKELNLSSSTKRLRKLQESDPNLFNLKKYNMDATVYSVLCQSSRQPAFFKESELNQLTKEQKSKLTKYWNFTTATPAYYGCYNSKYPYLSFRSDSHPLGYCLPCCKKTKPIINSQIERINNACIAQKFDDIKDLDDAMSRHVLLYGKEVPLSRISEIPSMIYSGIFLNKLPSQYNLYLTGVQQSNLAISKCGFIYSLVYIVSELVDVETKSEATDIFTELADLVLEMSDTYTALGDGGGALFSSAKELSDTILSSFVYQNEPFNMFSEGSPAFFYMDAIFTELIRLLYEIEIIVFSEKNGDISLKISQEVIMSVAGEKSNLRFGIILENEFGSFPIVMVNPKDFLRIIPEQRWMGQRRIFKSNYQDTTVIDNVASEIKSIVLSQLPQCTKIDLNLVLKYLHKSSSFELDYLLVNKRNMCYGVIVKKKNDTTVDRVYIPVEYSAYILDGTPVLFGLDKSPKPQYLQKLVIQDMKIQIVEEVILLYDSKTIGFKYKSLYFTHDPIEYTGSGYPVIEFPYDPNEINNEIDTIQIQPFS